MKDTYILKTGWNTIFQSLSDKQAGLLIKALSNYNATGEKPARMSDLEVRAYFNIMALDCDRFKENYDRRCETSRENGKFGGAGKGNQNARKQKVTEVSNEFEEVKKQPKNNLNNLNNLNNPKDKDKDNDNDLNNLVVVNK